MGFKSFAEFCDKLTIHVENKTQDDFYKKLCPRDNYERPLSHCKIDKSKGCIQKKSTSFA